MMIYDEFGQDVANAFGNAVEETCRNIIKSVVLAEREACAKIAEEWVQMYGHESIAEAIRNRSS